MVERKVTRSGKDTDGDITKLCQSGAAWSPRKKADAINDIESERYKYYVQQPGTQKAYVHVVNDPVKGKYLRTSADKDSDNNLDNLPDC